MLHILNLVDSNPGVHALASSRTNVEDVNGCTLIFLIHLDRLAFVVLLLDWTHEGWLEGVFGAMHVIVWMSHKYLQVYYTSKRVDDTHLSCEA